MYKHTSEARLLTCKGERVGKGPQYTQSLALCLAHGSMAGGRSFLTLFPTVVLANDVILWGLGLVRPGG